MKPADRTEKGIRFGCGFVFGLMLGGILGAIILYDDGSSMLGLVLVVATACGLGSLIFGGAFWRVIKNWIWWV